MMEKITIINAYGDKNIGDAVILTIAIDFINEAYDNNCQISVLCEDKKSFSKFINSSSNVISFQLPYGYAISAKKKRLANSTKILRFFEIFAKSFYHLMNNQFFMTQLPAQGHYAYIAEIENADVIVGMGGGYLTTNKKYTDYFGLLLTLLPISIAKLYKKKILMLPLSFGPFASDMQKRVAYHAIKHTTVIARDQITLDVLQEIDKDKTITTYYAPDLALFLPGSPVPDIHEKMESTYIVLTAREWFANSTKQQHYEHSLTRLIDTLWESYGLKTIFIPMARNSIEDDDNRVAKRMLKQVKKKESITINNPKSIGELQKLLAYARLAICTRMHSAILAVTVDTPFIAIGYGHKTLGFVKSFTLEKWHVDINDVQYEVLLDKFKQLSLQKNYNDFIKRINIQHDTVKNYKEMIINDIRI